MMPLYIAAAVALVCFILYALDRRMNKEKIDWLNAVKISGIGSLVSGGIAYSVMTPELVEVAKVVVPTAEVVQEMFVGTPSF